MEDKSILDLFWRRDPMAIEQTDKKYGARCFGISLGIVSNSETAEECVNDTYFSTWNAIPPQRPDSFPAFLYRIVRNISFDRVKERLAQKRGGGELALVYEELDECLASDISVEQGVEARELVRHIHLFLFSLSKEDRIIFSCRYWLMLPVAEIAQRLGCKESKVKASLHRSRKKLHDNLVKEEWI